MAKKKSEPPPTESQLRAEIARHNNQLVDLIGQITSLHQQLATARRKARKPPLDEAQITREIERTVQRAKGALDAEAIRAVIRELIGGIRLAVAPVRAAYLGPEHSFSHLAAIEQFGQSAELVPVASIATVFDEVQCGRVQYGIVPIENSTDGRIADTLDMFARMPLRICGDLQLRIHHNLLGKGPRSQIREVHSKPQALSQCREWLATNLPNARLVAANSTTSAAESAAEETGVAAIASRQAAAKYGLDVLAQNIEDNPDNITRFAVIGLQPAARTGKDKTSLMFELAHQPGALADAMAIFKRNRLNLTWIESFPKQGSQNEYLFFVELEGHANDMKVRRAISALEKKTVRIEVLGSYARTQPVG